MNRCVWLLFLALTLLGPTALHSQQPNPISQIATLKSASSEAIKVGAFADQWAVNGYRSGPKNSRLETTIRELAIAQFEIMTVPTFPYEYHLAEGSYSFNTNGEPLLDQSVEFLNRNEILWHCVPLVGPNPVGMQNGYEPKWLAEKSPSMSPAKMESILEDRVKHFFARYGARLHSIGVVNEALADIAISNPNPPAYRNSFWNRMGVIADPSGGTHAKYVVRAFEVARSCNPNVKLVYNDNHVETKDIETKYPLGIGNGKYRNEKQQRLVRLAKFLKERGILDAVGFQMHLSMNESGELYHFGSNHFFDVSSIEASVREIRELGLEVFITELDIGIPKVGNDLLAKQQKAYRAVTEAALKGGAETIITWGIADEDRPKMWRTDERALLFTSNFMPKPAFNGLLQALQQYNQNKR